MARIRKVVQIVQSSGATEADSSLKEEARARLLPKHLGLTYKIWIRHKRGETNFSILRSLKESVSWITSIHIEVAIEYQEQVDSTWNRPVFFLQKPDGSGPGYAKQEPGFSGRAFASSYNLRKRRRR